MNYIIYMIIQLETYTTKIIITVVNFVNRNNISQKHHFTELFS